MRYGKSSCEFSVCVSVNDTDTFNSHRGFVQLLLLYVNAHFPPPADELI